MATGADQILAKPGIGVDEGLSIVGNEMARALRLEPPGGGGLAHLRARLHVVDEPDRRRDVLDWRFVAALA